MSPKLTDTLRDRLFPLRSSRQGLTTSQLHRHYSVLLVTKFPQRSTQIEQLYFSPFCSLSGRLTQNYKPLPFRR